MLLNGLPLEVQSVPPLVIAVGFGNVVVPTILVIAIISWLISFIQDKVATKDPKGQRPDRNPRARPQGPTDIEEMLKQLAGDKRPPKSQPPKPERREPPTPKRPPQAERSRAKSAQPPQPPPPARTPLSMRQTVSTIEPKLSVSDLGSAVRTHHIGNRVDAAVQSDISERVQTDLGKVEAKPSAMASGTAHPLAKLLRDPNGVRQAVLLNEILKRPRSLQR